MPDTLPNALKTFTHPFDIRVFIDHNAGDWHMPMEWHTSLEVFIALKGRGRYYIGNRTYDFQEGDVFVINDNELHKSEICPGHTFDALMIMFSPDRLRQENIIENTDLSGLFYDRAYDFSHLCRANKELQENITSISLIMLKEYNRSGNGSLKSILSLLKWLLITLKREFSSDLNLPQPISLSENRKNSGIVSEVLKLIDAHYKEDINIGGLADSLYVSRSYLTRIFKKMTGYSIIKYITNKRIREAREILRSTDLPVSEVATAVGYNNITHFYLMFKKEIGINPGDFRKIFNSK